MIWFTSDWHFCHDREFIYKPRGFSNVTDMNAAIIKNHNEVVNYDDDVYCLGDCILNNLEEGLKCIKQLKGNIHIIKGNHDTDKKIEAYKTCYNVIEICDIKIIKYSKKLRFYLSHYPTITANFYKPGRPILWNLSGHTHSSEKYSNYPCVYNVAQDAHNCYPVSIEQIIKDINNQKERNYYLK